jgi:hypothetical protein
VWRDALLVQVALLYLRLRYSVTPRSCFSYEKLLVGKILVCWAATPSEFGEEGNKVLQKIGKSLPVDIAYVSGDFNLEKHSCEVQTSREYYSNIYACAPPCLPLRFTNTIGLLYIDLFSI